MENFSYTVIMCVNSHKKLSEFGSLHLAKRLYEQIFKKKDNKKDEKVANFFRTNIELSCSNIIEFVVKEFSQTVVRITEKHFTDELCDKLLKLLVLEFRKIVKGDNFVPEQKDMRKILEDCKHACYEIVKQDIFARVFEKITKTLRDQYKERYGRHTAAKKLQDYERLIKEYCHKIITEGIEEVYGEDIDESIESLKTRETEKHELKRLGKIFNLSFQTRTLKNLINSEFEVQRFFKSKISKLFGTESLFGNVRLFEHDEKYSQKVLSQLSGEYKKALRCIEKKKTREGNTDPSAHSKK